MTHGSSPTLIDLWRDVTLILYQYLIFKLHDCALQILI
jgi:hypothetical protein